MSISKFASLFCVDIVIMSSAVGLKFFGITAGTKKYKSILKNKDKTHDEIVLLEKAKLNTIEIIISKSLIESYISYEELF